MFKLAYDSNRQHVIKVHFHYRTKNAYKVAGITIKLEFLFFISIYLLFNFIN